MGLTSFWSWQIRVETTIEDVVETTDEGIVSEGLKGPGKSLLRG